MSSVDELSRGRISNPNFKGEQLNQPMDEQQKAQVADTVKLL